MSEILTFMTFDNDTQIQVFQRNTRQPVDFAPITRMRLVFVGQSVEVDSVANASMIDWSGGEGKIRFHLKDLNLVGEFGGILIVYDASHPNGLPLLTVEDHGLFFKFVTIG